MGITVQDTAETLEVVSFDINNLGTEVWLCENSDLATQAFRKGGLDDAARVAGECIVLRAHYGDDIPDEPDEVWLKNILHRTCESDRELVADLIYSNWEDRFEDFYRPE